MAEQKLVAEPRDGTGKGVARKLRAAGRVPAVMYGHGTESTALSVDARDLFHILHTGAGTNVLVDLVVDGSEHLIIPRDVQRDHIHGRFIHVDFLAVRRDEKLQLSIPVRIVGESVGVKAGGVVEHHLWELEVESLPGDVPEAIDADISALEIGMSLRVSDLVAPKGATILTNPDESVVAVQQPQMAVELEEEEAAEGEAVEGGGRCRGQVGQAGGDHRSGGRRGRRRGGGRRRRGRRGRRAVRGLDALAAMTWLVAGLGNPGERYAKTRHNLGYRVVDELAYREDARLRKARFVPADVGEIREGPERVLLAKARTFMNESGPAIASLTRKNDLEPDHVIAVHDDIDLAFGALRVKIGGSTAGHNGLRSLERALRSPEFYRVRLGVGRPTGRKDPADWVLEGFAKAQEPDVALLVDDGADAVRSLVHDGLQITQDRYNRSAPREP